MAVVRVRDLARLRVPADAAVRAYDNHWVGQGWPPVAFSAMDMSFGGIRWKAVRVLKEHMGGLTFPVLPL